MDVSDLAWWDGPGGWLAFGVLALIAALIAIVVG